MKGAYNCPRHLHNNWISLDWSSRSFTIICVRVQTILKSDTGANFVIIYLQYRCTVPRRHPTATGDCFMLLSWWCPFKIKKRKWQTRQFLITYRLVPLSTPVSCRWIVPLMRISYPHCGMQHGILIWHNKFTYIIIRFILCCGMPQGKLIPIVE